MYVFQILATLQLIWMLINHAKIKRHNLVLQTLTLDVDKIAGTSF